MDGRLDMRTVQIQCEYDKDGAFTQYGYKYWTLRSRFTPKKVTERRVNSSYKMNKIRK